METISSQASRRAFLRTALAAGAATVAAGSLIGKTAAQDETVSAASAYLRTLDYVNFRTGPGLDYGVIRVLPPNSPLTAVGASSGSFLKVSNQGDIGWVHQDYVGPGNGGSSDYPPSLGYKSTTANVNMRSGPGTGYSVKQIIETAKHVTGKDIPSAIAPRRAGDPAVLVDGEGDTHLLVVAQQIVDVLGIGDVVACRM